MYKICIQQLAVLFSLYGFTFAQNFTKEEILQGYALKGHQLSFIFDEGIYGVSPETVVLTGEFRNWDTDMQNDNWKLVKEENLWVLALDKSASELIKPGHSFKFRTDGGNWMAPPPAAPNEKNGNLIFQKDINPLTVKAELRKKNLVWLNISRDRSLNPADYILTDVKGRIIPILTVLPNESTTVLLIPKEELNLKRVYYLEIPALGVKTHCSYDGWFRTLYSDKELGANVDGNLTTILIFSPRASMVKLYLYQDRKTNTAYRVEELSPDENGIWAITIPKNLHGVYYDFTIHGFDEPGNHFYETNPVHITDPYARVSDNTWGKARIWEKTKAASPLKKGIPPMQDVIAYEVHVQDFTDLLPVDDKYKGTLAAMTLTGLTNSRGEAIGFDYLLKLGINTIHLMPVQEYVHFPDEDWKTSFQDDPYMIEQGISEENYQWGYRTSHGFAIESKYRTKDKEPGAERNEFRDLVQKFHDHNIAVIIDIVPNHTAENMDGNEWYFNFNVLDKQYYYRTKDFKHIGGYGNEVKTENRPMVQRWLIDQCKHFIEEFGIDGFRIDLAGQIDQQTLIKLKEAIGEDKILYGEAWIGSNDPAFEDNPDWDWYKEDSPITFFQDDARNAFKGPVFELNDKNIDRGWPGGKFEDRELVMKGLSNTFPDEKSPLSGINYLDIHDNFALADQFGKDFDGRLAVDEDAYKMAVALLYTSLGPIVTHGGSEIMRSKAHAPLGEVVKETRAGYKVYMHGYRDTYNHRKANQFIWEQVGQEPDGRNKNDYQNMYAFWQGMNAFRRSKYGQVFRQSSAVSEDYYQWILPEDNSLLGYVVDESVLVLLNAGKEKKQFTKLHLPKGKWRLIANNMAIDHVNGIKDPVANSFIIGGKSHDVPVQASGLYIWVNE